MHFNRSVTASMLPFPKMPDNINAFITAQLYRALPPPPDERAETQRDRDLIAMASVIRLCPATTSEAQLAVHAVAAQAHATQCLEAINQHRDDFTKAAQCRAQSALMMRQAAQALKELRILQDDRAARTAYRLAEIEAEAKQAKQEAKEREAEAEARPEANPATVPEPVAPEPDPKPLAPDLPRFAQAWAAEWQRFKSRGTGQDLVQRNHEALPRLPPSVHKARPSEAALIAALVPGAARPGGQSAHPGGKGSVSAR